MAQPFIVLTLVEDDAGVSRKIAVNATNIQSYGKWVAAAGDIDYRSGIVNSVVEVVNGNKLYVRETPAQIQSALALV